MLLQGAIVVFSGSVSTPGKAHFADGPHANAEHDNSTLQEHQVVE